MSSSDKQSIVSVYGVPHTKHIILADVNIPYKFSIDRSRNKLFFCINADEFSDQSFQSVILDLDSGAPSIVPNIRNGFASAIDNETGNVYLGGSDGIYKYNYQTQDIEKPAVISGVDVFDMFFKTDLYYVDTTNLDLHVFKDNYNSIVTTVEEYGIHHFAIDENDNIIFVNPTGLYLLPKDAKSPVRLCDDIENIRCVTTDTNGLPYVLAQNGIYYFDKKNEHISKVLELKNGYGLAFDKENNMVYSEERFVAKLSPVKNDSCLRHKNFIKFSAH